MAVCILCRKRKAKRQCPAVYNLICSHCCGTHRLKRLNCPSACPYLQQARAMEMEQIERDWQQQSAHRARVEEQITAYVIEEAISTGVSEHPEGSDGDVFQALEAVRDAVEREILSGVRQSPRANGLVQVLAEKILDNASRARRKIGIPHNVLLARVCRLVESRARYLSERSTDGKGYIRSVKIDVPPGSLDSFLNRLTASVRAG